MQRTSLEIWAPRLAAFGTALLLGVSVTWWVLHWPRARSAVPESAVQTELPQADAVGLARLLGANTGAPATVAPAATSRYRLVGVVAKSGGAGSAIIVVDGKPAKSFAVGSKVDEGLVLQSVAPRKAMLAADMTAPASQTLELSAASSSTGNKPPEGMIGQPDAVRNTPPTYPAAPAPPPIETPPMMSPGLSTLEMSPPRAVTGTR